MFILWSPGSRLQPSHPLLWNTCVYSSQKWSDSVAYPCHSGQVALLDGFCLIGGMCLQWALVISSFLTESLGRLLVFCPLVSCLFSKTLSQTHDLSYLHRWYSTIKHSYLFHHGAHHSCDDTAPHYSYHPGSLLSKHQGGFISDYDVLCVCLLTGWQTSIIRSKSF